MPLLRSLGDCARVRAMPPLSLGERKALSRNNCSGGGRAKFPADLLVSQRAAAARRVLSLVVAFSLRGWGKWGVVSIRRRRARAASFITAYTRRSSNVRTRAMWNVRPFYHPIARVSPPGARMAIPIKLVPLLAPKNNRGLSSIHSRTGHACRATQLAL